MTIVLLTYTRLPCARALDYPEGEVIPQGPYEEGDAQPVGSPWKSLVGMDVNPGPASSNPKFLGVMNHVLYFAANGGAGEYLWRSNGTASGTYVVKEVQPVVEAVRFLGGVVRNGVLYFAAENPQGGDGIELYRSEGTSSSTELLKEIYPGAGSSNPRFFTLYKDEVYFVANTELYGAQIWKTDGTPDGTVQVSNIGSNENFTSIIDELSYNAPTNLLLFVGYHSCCGMELWKSNGTSEGTQLVKDINPGSANAFLPPYAGGYKLTRDPNGPFLFNARTAMNGSEPWVSDGTESGTKMLRNISSNGDSFSTDFVHASGFSFFLASPGPSGAKLWRTNGTPEATTEVFLDPSPSFPNVPKSLVSGNGIVYFRYPQSSLEELWRTDTGFTLGFPLTTINPTSRAEIQGVTTLGKYAFFSAYNEEVGQEIWRTTGEFGPDGQAVVDRLTNKTIDRWAAIPYTQTIARVGCHLIFNGYHGGTFSENELGIVKYVCECGDGVVDPNEECDDGNENDYDSCDSQCHTNGGGGHVCPNGGIVVRDPLTGDFPTCPNAPSGGNKNIPKGKSLLY